MSSSAAVSSRATLDAGPNSARARAFSAAARHSIIVRWLRRALIFGSLGILFALAALALHRSLGRALGQLTMGSMAIDGTKISMDNPRLSGVRRGGDGYVVSAAKAIQDVLHPTQVDLVSVIGNIESSSRGAMKIVAATGHYDTENEMLDLKGEVSLTNPQYVVNLRSAHLDFKSGDFQSLEPVVVTIGAGNSINADSALVHNNGAEIDFDGHVRSLFQPANESALKSAGETQP